MIFIRRQLRLFSKAELGGNSVPKFLSASFLVSLWILFVILVSLNAYGIIQDPFGKALVGLRKVFDSLPTTGM